MMTDDELGYALYLADMDVGEVPKAWIDLTPSQQQNWIAQAYTPEGLGILDKLRQSAAAANIISPPTEGDGAFKPQASGAIDCPEEDLDITQRNAALRLKTALENLCKTLKSQPSLSAELAESLAEAQAVLQQTKIYVV